MSPSEAPTVKLTAHAQDESTRISVLDPNLNVIPESARLGETVVTVPPGVYCVRFQIGNDYVERIAILDGTKKEEHVWLSDADAPKFVTSAPVPQTSSTREFHREPARDLSLSPPWTVPAHAAEPKKGHLLLFARDLIPGRDSDPTFGLTLHAMTGDLLVNFAEVSQGNTDHKWAGAHVALAPGPYRLRQSGDRRQFVEQIVYVAKDWQTQIFLLADGVGERPRDRAVNLASASVLMARPGQGFEPDRPDLRWTESALRALRSTGNIPGTVRTEMMWEKFQNPMLGLYAGLLHIRREHIDSGLLRQVFHNLLGLIGPCPDVLAIGWALAIRDENARKDKLFMQSLQRPGDLSTPPMLRASWDLLVQASVLTPEIVPSGSFAERASLRLSTAEPWFSWRGEPPAAPFEPPKAAPAASAEPTSILVKLVPPGLLEAFKLGTLALALPYLRTLLQKMPSASLLLYTPRFTDLERRIAQYAYPMVDPQLRALVADTKLLTDEAITGMKEQSTDVIGLVRSLRIPAGTALTAVWGLVRKLQLQPVIPIVLQSFADGESHHNPVLASTLNGLTNQPTRLCHKRGGEPVNALAFLSLYYRGTPAAADEMYKGRTLADILRENEYVCGESEPSDAALASIATEVRTSVTTTLKEQIAKKTITLPRAWDKRVLPPKEKYEVGQLLPVPLDPQKKKPAPSRGR